MKLKRDAASNNSNDDNLDSIDFWAPQMVLGVIIDIRENRNGSKEKFPKSLLTAVSFFPGVRRPLQKR
jgi:hypothetical protein